MARTIPFYHEWFEENQFEIIKEYSALCLKYKDDMKMDLDEYSTIRFDIYVDRYLNENKMSCQS
jgi:hypothetical protein